jgi:Domain of unknown function (DUF4403)
MKKTHRYGPTLRTILLGVLIVAVFFGGTLWVLDTFFPRNPMAERRPALIALPRLPPVTRTSVIIAPVAVADTAIGDLIEAQAPRNLSGKRDNPLSDLLGKAEIGWNVSRGPIAVTGASSGLDVSAALNGTLRLTGQITNQNGKLSGKITELLGNDVGREVQKLATRALDQRADIRGHVTVTSRPALQPNWRIEPHLSVHVSLADSGFSIAGIKVNVADEVKPLLDRTVNDQIGDLSNRLRNDRTFELAARREWAKLCRSISLGAASAGTPKLWLEVRPTRAFAAQPRIVPDWVILTLGVQAETRIVPNATKPNCPFPQRLELVPQLQQGKVAVAVPIDVPFNELSRVLEAQLKGQTFPHDAGEIKVLRAKLAASGDRLLISLRVRARETKSWFGLGAEATVHIWGKPMLDRDQQMLRLTDVALDVDSQAAFGVLGAAARAGIPYLRSALAESAVVDLKPFAANAAKNIEAALADFRKATDGVEVETAITGLRFVGIAFDSTGLRVTAEADGIARALVRKIARRQ